MTAETLCKLASLNDTVPTRAIDLGYEHSFMQNLMESQLKDPSDRAPTKREINQRVKTQLKCLLPNIAENLTFNSLSPPGLFKEGFYDRTPYEETGS